MPGLSFGQQLHFQRYGIKEGLVHSGTGSREVIIQDREGFLWFSTHHGISRFDGIEFKNFRYDPQKQRSLGDNFTVGMVEADDGTPIYIHNRGYLYNLQPNAPGPAYFRCTPYFRAPVGKHDWLNRTVIVGGGERHSNPDHTIFRYFSVE